MAKYRLSQVAKLIDVAPITLKRWLLSGDIDEVYRDRNGWRVFTDEDVAHPSVCHHAVSAVQRPQPFTFRDGFAECRTEER